MQGHNLQPQQVNFAQFWKMLQKINILIWQTVCRVRERRFFARVTLTTVSSFCLRAQSVCPKLI